MTYQEAIRANGQDMGDPLRGAQPPLAGPSLLRVSGKAGLAIAGVCLDLLERQHERNSAILEGREAANNRLPTNNANR